MDQQPRPTSGIWQACLFEGGIVLVAVLLMGVLGVPSREQLVGGETGLPRSLLRGLLATLPMLAIFAMLMRSHSPPLVQLRQQVEGFVREFFAEATLWQLAMISLLAGVGEELLFRGVLQSWVSEWTSPWGGLIVASVLFGLAHAISKLYFLLATGIGFYFGWLVLEYHDLVAPMVAHGLYDFVVLVVLTRRGRSAT